MRRQIKLATITSIHNEAELLPQFLRHYLPLVDAMFFLDNESSDGSTAEAKKYPTAVIRGYSSNGEFCESLKRSKLEDLKNECAGLFDYVILADCDEFISTKSGISIKEELSRLPPLDFHWTHGFNMFSKEGFEYNPTIPLGEQLRTGFEDPGYAKPIIIKPESLHRYDHGMHSLYGFHKAPFQHIKETPFLLLHYVGINEEIFVKRCMIRARRLSPENRRLGLSLQYYSKSEWHYREEWKLRSESAKPISKWLSD